MDKIDFKKKERELYLPKQVPTLIEVPAMSFIMVDGMGEPGGTVYQDALQILYALTFTIKMSKMNDAMPKGYFEYVIPPLEGLWWYGDGALDWNRPKSEWCWTSMIRQPDFVTSEVFQWACDECKRKKPLLDCSAARLETFTEGLCVQMLHIGGYDEEQRSISAMQHFIRENGLEERTGSIDKHHEIYLSDPRRTATEKLKTVLRLPVK